MTDHDLCLAFDVADDELECDFVCDIERVQPAAYLNNDYASQKALRDWLDAVSNLPDDAKTAVLQAMLTLPTCNRHISHEIECLHRARELDALEPTESELCEAGY